MVWHELRTKMHPISSKTMNAAAQQILKSALALPEKDRAEIATTLLSSLDDVDVDEGAPEEIEKAWEQELQRRMDEIDRGEVELIPFDEVLRTLNERTKK